MTKTARTSCVKVAGTKYYLTDAGYGARPFAWVNDFGNVLNGRSFANRRAAMEYVGGRWNVFLDWTKNTERVGTEQKNVGLSFGRTNNLGDNEWRTVGRNEYNKIDCFWMDGM